MPPYLSRQAFVLTFFTGFPDPFAVATIGGEQTKTTQVIKKTLNPYWNESFDMCVPSEVLIPIERAATDNVLGAQTKTAC